MFVRFTFDVAPEWRAIRDALEGELGQRVEMKPRGAPHERRWVVRVPGMRDTCGAHRASDDTWELALRAPFSTALVEVLRSLGGRQRSPRELATAMGAPGLDYAAVLGSDPGFAWASPDVQSRDRVTSWRVPPLADDRLDALDDGPLTLSEDELDEAIAWLTTTSFDAPALPPWHAEILRCADEDLVAALRRWQVERRAVQLAVL